MADTKTLSAKWLWEWEGDGGKWQKYSEEQSDELTNAAQAGKKSVTFNVGNQGSVKLEVLFDECAQKNMKTGWQRCVRVWIENSGIDGCYHTWEWMDDKGTWRPYSYDVTLALESARPDNKNGNASTNGGTTATDVVSFKSSGRKYEVDLTAMTQKNVDTNVTRKIRSLEKKVDESQDATSSKTDTASASASNSTNAAAPGQKKTGTRNKRSAAAGIVTDSESDEEPKGRVTRSASNKRVKNSTPSVDSASSSQSSETSEPSAKKIKKSATSKSQMSSASASESTVKTVVVKGCAPVDPECSSKLSTSHVYCEGKDVYDAMLNQTNIHNNNNKFYLLQLLEEDTRKAYSVWFRWGRVGARGQCSLESCGSDLDKAKNVFCKKFADKTKNDWSQRSKFQKVAGKYDMVKLDYSSKNQDEEQSTKKSDKTDIKLPESKLDAKLQALIKLICDVKEMEDVVMEMKYDANKAPLGRLTADQIKAGYAALKKIDALISKKDFGSKLMEACNEFYTRIPHDFKMSRPPVIRTEDDVKSKMELLEALGDIEIAMRLLQGSKSSTENPIDSQYKSLNCSMNVMDHSDPMFQLIGEYVKNTHAPTHNQYKMKVLDVFCIDRDDEAKRFVDHGNRMLLWHGTRLTNMVGILSHGLRVAPPEAPVTGYMFGKGIYFADMSSKSANYCFPSRSKNVGIVLLCEVSLGSSNELMNADYSADKLPAGKQSVKGLGQQGPDPSSNHVCGDGMVIPMGKYKDTGISNPRGYTLNYNEYIVYDPCQVKMKYAVQIQFDFK